jgi:dihydrofolate synthase/folylpolyglutamate synthase
MTDIEVSYNAALDYLYSFVDFSLQKMASFANAEFKLERMQALVDSIGNPQSAYPCIHVAGTKGKGSVSALCANALHQAGYTTGLYTSPHLTDYAERIQVNGEFIPHKDLPEFVEEVKPYVAAIPKLTTFEITTAIAFQYFLKRKVDAAVIEVGLGGRLDATNVVVPEVSIITSISYDHTYVLGKTLAEIAREKAGIIKPGVPVVMAPQENEAKIVIERIAKEKSAQLIQVGRDIYGEQLSHSLQGQFIRVWRPEDEKETSKILSIPFLGSHQVDNATTAYAALDIFSQRQFKVNQHAIELGFSTTFWPGRFEVIEKSPPIILDCAHNRDSALKLRLTFEEYFPGKKAILIFGALEDKDVEGMYAELLPVIRELILVKSVHPRANETSKLVELTIPYHLPFTVIEHIPDALDKAVELAIDNLVVLVTGSISVVAEARKYWESKADIRRY